MSLEKVEIKLYEKLLDLTARGISKRKEKIIAGIEPASEWFGPRYFLDCEPDQAYLRMNSNSYLGLELHPDVKKAEEQAVQQFGCGPGAVRFISGTYQAHIQLEQQLAEFHQREAAMLFSSAYAAMTGVLPQLITDSTLIISDALNHNCIINAIRLSQPAAKAIYPHLDVDHLEQILLDYKGKVSRVCVVTDGVFSMRGDHAPLDQITQCCHRHESDFEEGIITIVDDSHGAGVFGKTGRGTEEVTNSQADVLIATLGKAMGVNGGYVVSNQLLIDYLRETAASYIYSNPITPAEAAAASQSLAIINSDQGIQLLSTLRDRINQLRQGIVKLGYETLQGDHPVVPLMIRDTDRTAALVQYLFDQHILVTGLNYPVVPKGEEEIRLQVSVHHTEKDIEAFLSVLSEFNH